MAIVNPFRKVRCPYCGTFFYPGNCAVVSSATGQVMHTKTSEANIFARTFVRSLYGYEYAKALARRQCPNETCQQSSTRGLLPRNVEHAESYTIAIVGDGSSGKSHYIASCIKQLMESQFLQVMGCSRIVGQGDTDMRYLRDYYNLMYRQGQMLPLTARAVSEINEPLIYELVFRKRSRLQPAKTVNLLFYDASGEDIVDPTIMVLYSHYILNASAIIFLADPQAMPGVVDKLPQHLKPDPNQIRQLSTSMVLNRIMQTFEQSQGVNPGRSVKTPVAITISKSDLLKFVISPGQTPLFLDDSVHTNQLDRMIFGYINNEVQEIIKRVGDRALLHAKDSFEHASFFAVSATGWSPDANKKFPAIEPLRCLDPLLWSLWQLGIIDIP